MKYLKKCKVFAAFFESTHTSAYTTETISIFFRRSIFVKLMFLYIHAEISSASSLTLHKALIPVIHVRRYFVFWLCTVNLYDVRSSCYCQDIVARIRGNDCISPTSVYFNGRCKGFTKILLQRVLRAHITSLSFSNDIGIDTLLDHK